MFHRDTLPQKTANGSQVPEPSSSAPYKGQSAKCHLSPRIWVYLLLMFWRSAMNFIFQERRYCNLPSMAIPITCTFQKITFQITSCTQAPTTMPQVVSG